MIETIVGMGFERFVGAMALSMLTIVVIYVIWTASEMCSTAARALWMRLAHFRD